VELALLDVDRGRGFEMGRWTHAAEVSGCDEEAESGIEKEDGLLEKRFVLPDGPPARRGSGHFRGGLYRSGRLR